MGWYTVIKIIRWVPYRYRQRAWREGMRVRTQCICLGRIDGDTASRNTTVETHTVTPAPSESWRAEVKDGLREIVRRLEGDHFVAEQIAAIDVVALSRAALLKTLRALAKDFEGNRGASEQLSDVIAKLAAFGNTTPESRDTWRNSLVTKLGIVETWMPTKELKEAVRTIIARGEIGTPENFITWLQHIDAQVDETGQARKQLRGAIDYVRNTTGTHTDASLMEMLSTREVAVRWVKPWSGTASKRKTPVAVDRRVIAAPVKMGVAVVSQPFAASWGGRRGVLGDGAWYARELDRIQIPDASRFRATASGVSAAEGFEHDLLHETCHAAWHSSRLNRDWERSLDGRLGRAANEVVTEMAACLIERKLGKKRPKTWEVSTHYVQHWLHHACVSEAEQRAFRDEAISVADYVIAQLFADGTMCRNCGGAVNGGNTTCGQCTTL